MTGTPHMTGMPHTWVHETLILCEYCEGGKEVLEVIQNA